MLAGLVCCSKFSTASHVGSCSCVYPIFDCGKHRETFQQDLFDGAEVFIKRLGWAKNTVFLFLQCFASYLLRVMALPLKDFNCESLICRRSLLMCAQVFFPCRSIVE